MAGGTPALGIYSHKICGSIDLVSEGGAAYSVIYTNDYYEPPGDRNLWVDKVKVYKLGS